MFRFGIDSVVFHWIVSESDEIFKNNFPDAVKIFLLLAQLSFQLEWSQVQIDWHPL